jgi:hypothetical protein
LREAVQRDRVGAVEAHVLLNLLKMAPDVVHILSIRWSAKSTRAYQHL